MKYVVLAFVGLALAGPAAAGPVNGTVRATALQVRLDVFPTTTRVGSSVAAAVTVSNLGDKPQVASVALSVPAGLVAPTSTATVTVAARGSVTVAFAVCAASQGSYTLSAHATVGTDSADSAGVEVTATPGTGSCTNRPPNCSNVVASPAVLWPVTRKLTAVTLSGATDPDGNAFLYLIRGVTQDEPVSGLDAADASPDAARDFLSWNRVFLRAERGALGDGRVYRIEYAVVDIHGGTCYGTTRVGVPRTRDSLALESPFFFDSFQT